MSTSSIRLEVDPEQRFLRFRVRGTLDVPAAHEALLEAIEAHPAANRLWDFREADLTGWSADDMRAFSESTSSRNPAASEVRVAALVARDVDFGFARMYEMLSDPEGPIRHAVFRDETEAEKWAAGTD